MRPTHCSAAAATVAVSLGALAFATDTNNFVNYETPHVAPIAMTPDGTRLLAVNTGDGRLEIFTVTSGLPVRAGSVPVGVDPVTVRARTNDEAWVVNHISDTVSIVDLTTLAVKATLKTQDEPWDVVFASTPSGQRAYVSCGQSKTVLVFDPASLTTVPTVIPIVGEQPKALALSPDGTSVYVAIFESGNRTTVLGGGGAGTNLGFPPNVVSTTGPYAGMGTPPNPPPNDGLLFDPPVGTANPPKVSLIVRKDAPGPLGQWMDDNAHNWTNWVSGANAAASGRPIGWDLWDHDVAVINTAGNAVTYVDGLMNLCMGMAVNPATGHVAVIGTDATNEIRYEPVLEGKFIKVLLASVNPATPQAPLIVDLNKHLYDIGGAFLGATLPQVERNKSLGDPRGIAFASSGALAYVTGMGSNNVIVVDGAGARAPADNVINVGEGPTGLALDEGRSRLHVLNKFAGSISTIDTATRTVIKTTPFFDPTPMVIKVGRKHLYDTHKNSGLGQISCASCHIDSKMDRLAWDLGDPLGAPIMLATVLATRNVGQGLIGLEPSTTPTPYQGYHPMKGPMTTQTLQDIIGHEPHHWRGDKLGLEEFNSAFIGLQGDDTNLTPTEMQEFEDFLSTITFPPNPFRNFNNTLPTSLPMTGHFTTGRFAPAGAPLPNGNAVNGLAAYRSTATRLDMGAFACVTCHTLPTGQGTDFKIPSLTFPNFLPYQQIPPGPKGERHLQVVSVDGTTNVTMKTPQLRNQYKKTGFNTTQLKNTAGFGVLHDGSVDSIERFVAEPVFNVTGDQMVADLTAFMLAFSGSDLPQGTVGNGTQAGALEPPGPASKDSPASVGAQTTAAATIDNALITSMLNVANVVNSRVSIYAKGLIGGKQRGWRYNGSGNWKSDRASEALLTTAALLAQASATSPITFTVVHAGLQTRMGIDRDEDGALDRDEASVCSDTADPAVFPGSPLCLDVTGNLVIDVGDVFAFLAAWFGGSADFNRSGVTEVGDIFAYLTAWFGGCAG